jgi:Kef-type K+ transport system membrane component KefB/nucleotide-binding universal stress UspA family protein
MEEALKPLSGHAILLVLLQISALLVIARLGSEFVRKLGLPTVVGELAAGILLGPTVFGHFYPAAFLALFPRNAEQFHLLEIVSWIGMILLLLLTGIETDVRLLRNLGRTALGASVFGMLVPFVFGLGLGWVMPDRYVAAPDHRTIFALFLATAMSISAMPVIAKILLDLDLTRRNIGVVILSAGVVDDTTGWLILSLIAGAATTGAANVGALAVSIFGVAAFLVLSAFVLYPALKFAFRVATDRFESKDTDLVLMIVVTLLCAAVTELLRVHAVFGAFVAGTVIRQVPRIRKETLHTLESVTFSLFAPIFFGIVGLKVDLWKLGDASMLLIVLGVATAGKLVGCTVGSLLGGLRIWESLSIAVAMNARGAMELVVATIGLSLGILNQEMYSIVVMVAVTTSFMAPVLLRLTMKAVRMTEDEAERMAADRARGFFDPAKMRILVPTAGGPNALAAAAIGLRIARRSAHPITVLYVERITSWMRRIFRRETEEGQNLGQHLDALRKLAAHIKTAEPDVRRQSNRDVVESIQQESGKGYDLVLVGASQTRRGIRGEKLEKLVGDAPCHVAIVQKRGTSDGPFSRILVPVDGSFSSRVAVEFAIRYAEGVGDSAVVTLAIEGDGDRRIGPTPSSAQGPVGRPATPAARPRANSLLLMAEALTTDGGLEKLSPIFKATKVKTRVVVKRAVDGDPNELPILAEANQGTYDLMVLGAENRAIHYRLFFGYENEKILEESRMTVVLLVPKMRSE